VYFWSLLARLFFFFFAAMVFIPSVAETEAFFFALVGDGPGSSSLGMAGEDETEWSLSEFRYFLFEF